MNETIEMKTPDIKYSKSECLKYQGVTVFNDVSQKPCDGEYTVSETIVRFRNGLLHSDKTLDGLDIPAYETETGHTEYFKNGFLHREKGPAVITDWGDWEEWWNEGELIFIRARGTFKTEIEKKENQ